MATVVGTITEGSVQLKHSLLQAWVVCLSASLFFLYEFAQLNMFNAIGPALFKDFDINAAQLGQLSANYFYANMIFLFPAGTILDRVSTRKVILSAMLLCVTCTFIFSQAKTIWVAEACRFFTGVGGAFCFLSCVRLASRWFPPRHLALVIGVIVTIAMLGGMIAQTPMTLLTDHFGWRRALFVDACIGVGFMFIIAAFVRNCPPGQEIPKAKSLQELYGLTFFQTLRYAVSNPQNWLGGIYTSLLNLPIFIIGAIWGSPYLTQVRGLTSKHASFVTSMIFVGTIVGSSVVGWFSDRIARRKLPMIWGAILALGVIILIMFVPHLSLVSLMVLVFALGFFTSAQVISYPLVAESNPIALTGTSVGLASVLIMSGGMVQPFFGWLMELHWDHTIINHIPVYSPSNYLLAMSILPVAFVLGLIAALFVRETHCQTKHI